MNKEAFDLLKKIFDDRSNYYRKKHRESIGMAYETAWMLVEYALDNNIECLRQFDYYGES